MGGSAFTQGPDPLFTPRMPKEFYFNFKAHCSEVLRSLYDIVESPIDGPGKTDFGDIDLAVCGPKADTISTGTQEAIDQISKALGAVRMIVVKSEAASSNLAVPWPENDSDRTIEPTEHNDDENDTRDTQGPKYIQVDVNIFSDRSKLYWETFKHAHGDIWNIIGATIRPYGLTVDNQAMWLRIPEIEETDKKRARVKLSSTPEEVLEFLDLPVSTYFQGQFPDLQTMYEYVAQCRMFHVPPPKDENEDTSQNGETQTSVNDQGRLALKSNDRRRMKGRPAFSKWVDEFKPECRQQGRFSEKKTTREQVTAEAIARFDVGKEFKSRRTEFLLEKQRLFISNTLIREAVPAADVSKPTSVMYRSCLIKALKKVILESNRDYGVEPPEDWKDPRGMFDLDKVSRFIEAHMDEIAIYSSR